MFKWWRKLFKKPPVERICKNCRLFNPETNTCLVVILCAGEKIHLPVDPEDDCFFEQEYFDPITGEKGDLNAIKEIRFWVEDESGQKIDGDGIVKMEYPID